MADSESMPPPQPKKSKIFPSKTSASDPAASTAGAGVCPAPDSEASEASSLVEEEGRDTMKVDEEDVLQGRWNDAFFQMLMGYDKGVAKSEKHSPSTCFCAWKELLLRAEHEHTSEPLHYAKRVIWEQTEATLRNNRIHMEVNELATLSPPIIVGRGDLAGHRPNKQHRQDTEC